MRQKTALNARLYNTNAMLSPSKPKPIVSLKITKTGYLIIRERRESRPLRAHGFSETIPLDFVAPRRHAPRRVLHQPQRCCPIKRRQRHAVTRSERPESLNIESLTLPLARRLLSIQFFLNLRRAYSLSCPSIVVPRPKSLERTSSRRRPSLRATITGKAR